MRYLNACATLEDSIFLAKKIVQQIGKPEKLKQIDDGYWITEDLQTSKFNLEKLLTT